MQTTASTAEAPTTEQVVCSVPKRERYTSMVMAKPVTERCIVYGAERYWTSQEEQVVCSPPTESINYNYNPS